MSRPGSVRNAPRAGGDDDGPRPGLCSLGALIIIEVIFGWPGIGHFCCRPRRTVITPSSRADTFVFAAIFIATNIVTDAALILIDPSIRPQ